MLNHFHITQQGTGHLARGIECQDASLTRVVGPYIIAAIADGVGSCEKSSIGASTAVACATRFIERCLSKADTTVSDGEMSRILNSSFRWAETCQAVKASAEKLPASHLDSTLTIAVYDSENLWFEHVGDDGIVALQSNGKCSMVTTRHKGLESNSVVPLRDHARWQFGKVENVASFAMMTDGLLNCCVGTEAQDNSVYLPFLRSLLYAELRSEKDVHTLRSSWDRYLWSTSSPKDTSVSFEFKEDESGLRVASSEAPYIRDDVKDDITLVLVHNSDLVSKLPPYSFDYEAWKKNVCRWEAEAHERRKEQDRLLKEAALARMQNRFGCRETSHAKGVEG